MKQYKITFFRTKKDGEGISYYREFESIESLLEWCKDVQNECRYYTFYHTVISLKDFLKNI